MSKPGESMTPENFMAGRRTYWCKSVEYTDEYGSPNFTQSPMLDPEATGHDANLVSSALEGSDMHKPCLDIDIPCLQIMSSTEGHSHLYFDKELSWEQYAKLLGVLGEVGIADPKWVQHSLDKHQSTLRPPGVKKPDLEEREQAFRVQCVEQGYSYFEVDRMVEKWKSHSTAADDFKDGFHNWDDDDDGGF